MSSESKRFYSMMKPSAIILIPSKLMRYLYFKIGEPPLSNGTLNVRITAFSVYFTVTFSGSGGEATSFNVKLLIVRSL